MTIELITKEQHKEILDLQKEFPVLTFQNKGYQYINPKLIGEDEEAAIKKIETILHKAVVGFSSFTNFKLTPNGEVRIRMQYGYDASFTGVGYIKVDELLNGFNRPIEEDIKSTSVIAEI